MRWLLVAPAFVFREISGEGGDDNLTSDMFSYMQILLINFNQLSHSTISCYNMYQDQSLIKLRVNIIMLLMSLASHSRMLILRQT